MPVSHQVSFLQLLMTGIHLGNADSEIFTSYRIHVIDRPGIITSQPEFQGDTGNGVPVNGPLGSGKAESCSRK